MSKVLGNLILRIRETTNLNQKEFGVKYLGSSIESAQQKVSQYENNIYELDFDSLVNVLKVINIDLMHIIQRKLDCPNDPEIEDDIKMASKVLKSKIGTYSSSLKMNIHSFHDAIEEKERNDKWMKEIENRIQVITGDAANHTESPFSIPAPTPPTMGEKALNQPKTSSRKKRSRKPKTLRRS